MAGYVHRLFCYFSKLFDKEEKKKTRPEIPSSRYYTPPLFPPYMFSNAVHSIKKFKSDSNLETAGRFMIRNPHQTPLKRFGSHNPYIPREFSRDNFNKDSHTSACNGKDFLDSYPIPPYKGSQPPSAMATNSFPECGNCGNFISNQERTHLRKNPASDPDCSLKANASSKLPPRNPGRSHSVRPGEMTTTNRARRHRGVYTLKRKSEEIIDQRGMDAAAGGDCLKSLDICNWLVYRTDTILKFERVFKYMAKMRHTNGNIIDAKTHIFWMVQSGITADKEGAVFKRFAGGKVVLTFGEYKFLIHKLCCIHELDYWDTLRKMATFQGDDLDNDVLESG